MEYNTCFTRQPVRDKVGYGKKYTDVIDENGKIVCGVTSKRIVDLNGEQIAKYSHKEVTESEGKKRKCLFFIGEYGEMKIANDQLFLGEELIGHLQEKTNNKAHSVLLGMACILLALLIVIVAMIDLPVVKEFVPILTVTDDEGAWTANGEVAVFDGDLYPGVNGEYQFIIDNPHNEKLLYDFSLVHCYNGTEFHFPIDIGNGKVLKSWPLVYRLRVNNGILETEKWLTADELDFENLILLPNTKCLITLEWKWSFESGDDELDTIIGNDSGIYSLVLFLTAESNSEKLWQVKKDEY